MLQHVRVMYDFAVKQWMHRPVCVRRGLLAINRGTLILASMYVWQNNVLAVHCGLPKGSPLVYTHPMRAPIYPRTHTYTNTQHTRTHITIHNRTYNHASTTHHTPCNTHPQATHSHTHIHTHTQTRRHGQCQSGACGRGYLTPCLCVLATCASSASSLECNGCIGPCVYGAGFLQSIGGR